MKAYLIILLATFAVLIAGCAELDRIMAQAPENASENIRENITEIPENEQNESLRDITHNITQNITRNATNYTVINATCPRDLFETRCPVGCDECNKKLDLPDGRQCMECIIYKCPSGSYKNECPDDCDFCNAAVNLSANITCYECGRFQCPQNSWKSEEECLRNCGSDYEGCEVKASEGNVSCWSCGGLNCEKWCEDQKLTVYNGTDVWNNYILDYLNRNGRCKENVDIFFGRVSLGNCVCAKPPVIDISGDSVCENTPCGNVPCDTSTSCSCGANCQITVSCSWGGWIWQGGANYLAVVGANSS